MTTPDHQMFDLGIPGITDAVEIGAGGFGTVYRAVEEDLGRTVAVKVLSGNLSEADQLRFDRERRAMGTLSGHPNIVTVYRSGYAKAGNAYLVMEFLADGSLTDRLRTSGPIPWPEVLKFGIQLCGALETSHRAGVLHRDVKPANVLLSRLGNTKLCDFGIARLHGAPETRSAVITASVAHAPPEILNGQRPDEVADVYSLASTMFELLTGAPPFVHPTDESMVPILVRIQQDPVPLLPPSQLPAALADVLHRAMSKDPTRRPNSAAAFGRLLVAAERELGLPPTPLPIESLPDLGTDEAASAGVPPFSARDSGSLPPPVVPTDSGMSPATVDSGPMPAPVVPMDSGSMPPPVVPAGSIDAEVSAGRPLATTVAPHSGSPLTAPDPGLPARGRQLPIAAAALVAVIGLGALTWLVLRDRSDDRVATPTTETATASETGPADDGGPATSVADGAPESELVAGLGDGDYPFYVRRSDTSGVISILVPDEWTEIEPGPGVGGVPFLAAAPVLEGAFFDSFAGAGVSVSVENGTIFDLNAALDDMRLAECASAGRSDVFEPYRGRTELLTDCGETETQLIHVVFIDSIGDRTIEIRVQVIEQRDVSAAETVIDSLILQ